MPRPFSLEKCTSRDQVLKQFERMVLQLSSALTHAEILMNSFDDNYPKQRTLCQGMYASIGEIMSYVEEAKLHF